MTTPANDLPEGWELLQQISRIARKINPAALSIAEDIAGMNISPSRLPRAAPALPRSGKLHYRKPCATRFGVAIRPRSTWLI